MAYLSWRWIRMIFSTCSVSCSNNVINWSLLPTILHISTIAMYLLRLITSNKNINTVVKHLTIALIAQTTWLSLHVKFDFINLWSLTIHEGEFTHHHDTKKYYLYFINTSKIFDRKKDTFYVYDLLLRRISKQKKEIHWPFMYAVWCCDIFLAITHLNYCIYILSWELVNVSNLQIIHKIMNIYNISYKMWRVNLG